MNLRELLNIADKVVDNADNTGCSDDLTVTSREAVADLETILGDFREFVETWERNFPDKDSNAEYCVYCGDELVIGDNCYGGNLCNVCKEWKKGKQ